MRGPRYCYKSKIDKIMGISLGIIGFLIVINSMPIRFLLLLIGIGLLLIGTMLFMK